MNSASRSNSCRILDALAAADGAVVETEDLAARLYEHRDDGGPLAAVDCVRTAIWILRRRGIEIDHVYGLRVVSRTHPRLSQRQMLVVDAIQRSGGEGTVETIARSIGMTLGQASALIHLARARGLILERICGYRLRETATVETRRAA